MKTLKLAVLFFLIMAVVRSSEAAPRKLIVALDNWPPFEYLDEDEIKGINVEIISRILTRLEVPFEFKYYPFTRTWMLAAKGKVDVVSSVSYQSYRENVLVYTEDQKAFGTTGKMPKDFLWKTEYVFFLEKHHAESFKFKSYDQEGFKNYQIGVVKDYSYNNKFREADLRKKTFPTVRGAFRALANGEIDLVPMDPIVGSGIIKELGVNDKITYSKTPLFSKPYLLASTLNSDYPDLQKIMADFYIGLAKMRATGEYESIYEQYIRPDYLSKINRPLRFVCEEWAPLEYMDGGQVQGVDAAVVEYIMKRLGIPYEISIYPWSRAWMMAEKGKADAVLSISHKSSREKVLFYTKDQKDFSKTGKLPENYLWMSEYVFFVMKNSAKEHKFESYQQLKKDGVKVGRNRDYSYDPEFLAAKFEGPLYSKAEDGLLALVSGDIDVYPMDKTVGSAMLQKLGIENSVTWLPKQLFSKPYLSPFCRKSDFPELEKIMTAFYRELRLMRSSGLYDEMRDEAIKAINRSK